MLRIVEVNGLPVIEGTAAEMVHLATAAAGAAKHSEAVIHSKAAAVLGLRVAPAISQGGTDGDA
jgi:hypothetical protein